MFKEDLATLEHIMKSNRQVQDNFYLADTLEDLEKALDMGKLVPVQTPVHGKNGTYMAIRYVSPFEAKKLIAQGKANSLKADNFKKLKSPASTKKKILPKRDKSDKAVVSDDDDTPAWAKNPEKQEAPVKKQKKDEDKPGRRDARERLKYLKYLEAQQDKKVEADKRAEEADRPFKETRQLLARAKVRERKQEQELQAQNDLKSGNHKYRQQAHEQAVKEVEAEIALENKGTKARFHGQDSIDSLIRAFSENGKDLPSPYDVRVYESSGGDGVYFAFDIRTDKGFVSKTEESQIKSQFLQAAPDSVKSPIDSNSLEVGEWRMTRNTTDDHMLTLSCKIYSSTAKTILREYKDFISTNTKEAKEDEKAERIKNREEQIVADLRDREEQATSKVLFANEREAHLRSHPPTIVNYSDDFSDMKNFNGPEETRKALGETHDETDTPTTKWYKELTKQEATYGRYYTHGGSYTLNAFFRGQARPNSRNSTLPSTKDIDKYDDEDLTIMRDAAKNLDSAISKYELPFPMRCTRLVMVDVTGTKNQGYDKLEEFFQGRGGGSEFQDKGYCSVAASGKGGSYDRAIPDFIDNYLARDKVAIPILIRINVPKGKGIGMYVDGVSDYKGQNEFVLARGTKFRVKTPLRETLMKHLIHHGGRGNIVGGVEYNKAFNSPMEIEVDVIGREDKDFDNTAYEQQEVNHVYNDDFGNYLEDKDKEVDEELVGAWFSKYLAFGLKRGKKLKERKEG